MAIIRKALLILLIPAASFAANITGAWFSTSEKVARQDLWPRVNCTTCTRTTNWDNHRARLFGAKGEILHGIFYLQDNTVSDATNVNIQISSFTDNAGHFIIPLTVSSTSVWDSNLAGPVNLFYYQYLQITGLSQLNYDPTEIDERDLPPNLRVPCVPDGNNQCSPTTATRLWTNRPDHDKFYPEIALPYESIKASSFTVAASSSQAIGMDVYIATDTFIPSNQSYNIFYATMSVFEGTVLSTAIPIQLKVYNFTMPTVPHEKVTAAVGPSHIGLFHYNVPPGTGIYVGVSSQTTREHYYQYLWRNGVIPVGDGILALANSSTRDWPTNEYHRQLTGELFTPSNGFGNSPRVSTGVPFYMLGTYTNWIDPVHFSSVTMTGGAGAFCTNISSWSVNLGKYPGVRSALYMEDEAEGVGVDPTTGLGDFTNNVDRLANALSNTCTMPSAFINSWATCSWVEAVSSAPHVNMPAAAYWAIHSHVQTDWPLAAARYITTGSTQGWTYNGASPASGSSLDTGDTGMAAQLFGAADFKKGVQGHFFWEIVNWDNSNNSPNTINDLWNDAKTFGGTVTYSSFNVTGVVAFSSCPYADSNGHQYNISATTFISGGAGWLIMLSTNANDSSFNPSSAYPGTLTKTPASCTGDSTLTYSSWTKTLVEPVRGQNGFNHGLGDGVAIYPGHNTQDPTHDYGIDGPIGGFRFKMMRNGINMYDYAYMAYQVNPTSATAIINTIVPNILYEVQPVPGHGYYWGGRYWSDDPQVWESNRELLAQWVAASTTPAITSSLTASGTSGFAFSYQSTANNNASGFTASSLPTGLSMDSFGLISGIPTVYGTYNVTLTPTNAIGAGTPSTLSITLNRVNLPYKIRFR